MNQIVSDCVLAAFISEVNNTEYTNIPAQNTMYADIDY